MPATSQAIALWTLATALYALTATAAEPPPLEAFLSNARVQSVAISPDARYLSLIIKQDGRQFVAVKDRSQPAAPVKIVAFALPKDYFNPSWCGWANPTRLLCGFRGRASEGNKFYPVTRLVGVNADGSEFKMLSSSRSVWAGQFQDRIIDWTPDDPKTVLQELDEGAEFATRGAGGTGAMLGGTPDGNPSIYALDVYSGKRTQVLGDNSTIQRYTTDGHGHPRIGVGVKKMDIVYYGRLDGTVGWRELSHVKAFERTTQLEPIAAIPGTNFAYARGEHEGREAIWKIDLTDATDPQLLFAHPQVDLGQVLFTQDRHLLGVAYNTERPGTFYTDPQAEAADATLRRAMPGRAIHIVDMTPDSKVFVVYSESDVTPPMFHVLDLRDGKSRLEAVASPMPALATYALSPMLSISFAARDGARIPGYLTMPARSAPGKPPLVVLPHGGPQTRDIWGFDSLVQYLASRGYAVLQLEFRGSSGYGAAWWRAGFRDWGGLPYDDVIDATRWALAEGYADPARTCIVGASYGGYMALIAATRNADKLFRCAVSISGISDLVELRNDQRFFRNSQIAVASMESDPAKLKEDSPRSHAAAINIPVLLIHGDSDYTVEVDHTRMMDAALTRAGKVHETVIIEGADHYFDDESQQRSLYTRLGAFLETQLAGKAP